MEASGGYRPQHLQDGNVADGLMAATLVHFMSCIQISDAFPVPRSVTKLAKTAMLSPGSTGGGGGQVAQSVRITPTSATRPKKRLFSRDCGA
jgi:hypothetical protein